MIITVDFKAQTVRIESPEGDKPVKFNRIGDMLTIDARGGGQGPGDPPPTAPPSGPKRARRSKVDDAAREGVDPAFQAAVTEASRRISYRRTGQDSPG